MGERPAYSVRASALVREAATIVTRGGPVVFAATVTVAIACGLLELAVRRLAPGSTRVALIPFFVGVFWVNVVGLVGFARAIGDKPRFLETLVGGLFGNARPSHGVLALLSAGGSIPQYWFVLGEGGSSFLAALGMLGVVFVFTWEGAEKQLIWIAAVSRGTTSRDAAETEANELRGREPKLYFSIVLLLLAVWMSVLLPRKGIVPDLLYLTTAIPLPVVVGCLLLMNAWLGAALWAAFVAVARTEGRVEAYASAR